MRPNKYVIFSIAAFFLVIAVLMESGPFRETPEHLISVRVQNEIKKNERELQSILLEISEMLVPDLLESNIPTALNTFNRISEKEGLSFLVFRGDKLLYWSDRSVSFTNHVWNEYPGLLKLVHLPNGYYLSKELKSSNYRIIGLILIKYDYPYENDFLTNFFSDNLKIPTDYTISGKVESGGIPVYDSSGNFLMKVVPSASPGFSGWHFWLSLALYLLGLFFILWFFRVEFAGSESAILIKLAGLVIRLFILYWLHILFRIPGIFYEADFFSPDKFAFSSWLPSLGDYLIVSIFLFLIAFSFYDEFTIEGFSDKNLKTKRIAISALLFSAGIIFLLVNFLVEILITNSNISFSLNQINTISPESVFGFIAVALLLLSAFLILFRIVEESKKHLKNKELILFAVVIGVLLGGLSMISGEIAHIPAMLLFVLLVCFLVLFSQKYFQNFTLSYMILFISMITVYSVFIIYSSTVKKEREIQKNYAVNLVEEHDPAAEVFLTEIQQQIRVDSEITKHLFPPYDYLEGYIARTYFTGFFRKYDLQVSICSGSDKLLLKPDNVEVPCFPFFEKIIDSRGQQIPGTNFYYVKNMNGRITYLGRIHYPLMADSIGISIFIEIVSQLQSEGIGYPELLIDKKAQKPEPYKIFNYAKYYGGELVDKYGDYEYNYYIYSYEPGDKEFEFRKFDGFEHLLYRTGDDNNVIVSRELFTFVDYLISFPYLFVFYFAIFFVFLLLTDPVIRKRSLNVDLKFKIQAAILSIVFVSLLIVALGTLFYNINEYQTRHRDDLNEKKKSITDEIDMRLQDVDGFNPETTEWLKKELANLSNIFRTDINIFGNNGELVATSRPEIFTRGLVSTRMNAEAFYQLSQNFQINYFQPEKIGNLSYLSAYEPIINDKGTYLGYINLPYFIRQDKYNQEISTLIVAFINLYLLLLLASIVVAILISNQITKPLAVIRDNLREMELGKKNEPINYKSRDEIGDLIREYNKKLDELSVSAELLARSERESAWREMAKQIAHEIKNPLTPMKLNIQHLQRTKTSGKEYHEFIDRVTKALIEQIDTLSDIATEFSNFAQIPTARNQVFNLASQIRKVINLYESEEKATIHFSENNAGEVRVNIDREQISRALINLIKNAIQAIPDSREGKVDIRLTKKGDMVEIAVEDNGTGIPEEMIDKIFSPSFTTKSSGMGLGLAIVKNIAENFRGKAWFQTQANSGSVFYIEIPVYPDEK